MFVELADVLWVILGKERIPGPIVGLGVERATRREFVHAAAGPAP